MGKAPEHGTLRTYLVDILGLRSEIQYFSTREEAIRYWRERLREEKSSQVSQVKWQDIVIQLPGERIIIPIYETREEEKADGSGSGSNSGKRKRSRGKTHGAS